MHPDHKQKANRNGGGLVGNIKVCIWARFFSLDHGLSRNLSFLPYLERWDLLDISRTLYAEVHKEKFTPKFFYYLLLKFENFSTSIQRGTLETLTPVFCQFWALQLHEFLGHLREVFCRNVQHQTCSKFTHLVTVKIWQFLAYHTQFTSSLFAGISGWTVTGKPKDMTILESDIAKGWLAKLCTTIVGMFGWILRIFGEESGRYEFFGKDQYSAPSVSVTVWVRHFSTLILFSMELLWIPN